MSKIRKILLVILTAVFVSVGCAAIVACSGGDWREPKGGIKDNGKYDKNNPGGKYEFYYPDGVDPKDYEDKNNRYVIETTSMGGMPLSNIRVTVSQNGSDVIEGISQNGKVEFGIPMGNYDLAYGDLPDGYREDSSGTLYHLTPESLEVKTAFTSSVINTLTPAGTKYRLGDVMYNFSISDGETTMILSEILKEKRLVVLNFWATWCDPCVSEFPLLNSTYLSYKETAEVVAITQEPLNTAKGFKSRNDYKFFMANDSQGLFSNFDTSGIPVSVFIDRYGVVGYITKGAVINEMEWISLFKQYTADDYQQNLQYDDTGDTGSQNVPTKPGDEGYEQFTQDLDSNDAYNQAFLEADTATSYDLEYHGPDEDTEDALYFWPWRAKDDDVEGMYISPSNIGVNNSNSIIRTEITIEADDTLSVEFRINTDADADKLFIVVNNSLETTYEYSGATSGWQKLVLFEATRHTTVTIALVYVKDTIGPDKNEFVGLRNLKVTPLTIDPNEPKDIRTEVVSEDGSVATIEEPGDDGFYHVKNGTTDSILFVNIIGETLWSDRHLAKYELRNVDNTVIAKSIYNISYWVFNSMTGEDGDYSGEFKFGKEHSDTIIDCFYIQDSTDVLVPVTARVAEALKAFVRYAYNGTEFKGIYQGEYDQNTTWLELCNYYRTLGGSHDTKEHAPVCKAHNNPAEGRNFEYAIELKVAYNHEDNIINSVDTNRFTLLNFAGGLFYKLTAEKSGVYSIKSLRPSFDGDAVDPKIMVWPADGNGMSAYGYGEQEDSRSAKDYLAENVNHNNFNYILYLEENEVVYPQITTRLSNYTDIFDVVVEYLGTEWWELEVASTANGMWVGEGNNYTYAAVESTLIDGYYYRMTDDFNEGSLLYIDLIHRNFYDANNHSIEDYVGLGYFNLGSVNYTPDINRYISIARAKDESDPTYGMVPADADLVRAICALTNARDEDGKSGIESGIWEAFAFYWEYYGGEGSWKELPENWQGFKG